MHKIFEEALKPFMPQPTTAPATHSQKEKIHVPRWLQNELYKISEPIMERFIESHKEIGINRFGLQSVAEQLVCHGYFHANPNPPEEKPIPHSHEEKEGRPTPIKEEGYTKGTAEAMHFMNEFSVYSHGHGGICKIPFGGGSKNLTEQQAEANAARIVKAWNEYDGLKKNDEIATSLLKVYEEENELLKEQMAQSLRLYENQNQMIIKLQEANRELLEALKIAVSYVENFIQKGGIGEAKKDLSIITSVIQKHTK